MLDFEIRTHFLHHLVIQIGTIVGNDLPRKFVPTNQLPLDESGHYTHRDIGVGSRFEALGLMAPMTSIPHMEKGQEEDMTLRGCVEALTLSANA